MIYAERDIEQLDIDGGYYRRHISAMTGENLYSKSRVAAELGYRDKIIDDLLARLEVLVEEHYAQSICAEELARTVDNLSAQLEKMQARHKHIGD